MGNGQGSLLHVPDTVSDLKTASRYSQMHILKFSNRRVPNGTHGGVRVLLVVLSALKSSNKAFF